ncbi:MAG: hypothetical protein ABI743_10970, partial [bacterium]
IDVSPGPGSLDPDGSLVLYEYDYNYTGAFTPDAASTSTAPITSPPLSYNGGARIVAIRVTDDNIPPLQAIDTEVVLIAPPSNVPPTAVLNVATNPVRCNENTALSPGPGTTDPDGSIVAYEYDFDYTGVFTVDATSPGTSPQTSPLIPDFGLNPITRQMALRVRDNGTPQLEDIDVQLVTINPPTWTQVWEFMQDDGAGNSCIDCHNIVQPPTFNGNKTNDYNAVILINPSFGSCQAVGMPYVNPTFPAGSLLYRKLGAVAQVPCGSRQPFGGPYWNSDKLEMMRWWILRNAPND